MRYLLDVNTLIALLDPRHVFHDTAHHWLSQQPSQARLLTSPIVQNGVMRVVSHAKYPNHFGPANAVREILREFCDQARHEFCPDDISLLDAKILLHPEQITPSRVTDLYLLALAIEHRAQLATFDSRIPVTAVAGGQNGLCVIRV